MLNRVTLLGLALIAAPALAFAQSPAPAADRAPGDHPVAIDGSSTVPNNVPDVIAPPEGKGDATGSKAVSNPRAALEPPAEETIVIGEQAFGGDMDVGFHVLTIAKRPLRILSSQE